MKFSTFFKTTPAVLLGIAMSLSLVAMPLSAQTPVEDLFELDGNAIDESNINGPDDEMPPDDWAWGNDTGSWDYVAGLWINDNPPPGGLAHLSSFVNDPNGEDEGGDDIFVGGASKDDLHIKAGWGSNGWQWDYGTAPDKDDLLGVAAAAYIPTPGELLIYDFGSLFAANGASSIGNWFFKKDIGPCADGTFGVVDSNLEGRPCLEDQPEKLHSIGDILIISENTNGGTTTNISVYKWIGNDPEEVQKCEDHEDHEVVPPKDNLCMISDFAGATCDGDVSTNPFACGRMNQVDSESPDTYDYMSKSPPDAAAAFPAGTDGIDFDDYPAFTFFESGINISEVLKETECFSSFMKSTRTSHEPRSRLKDFASGAFELCGIAIDKGCEATLNDDGDQVDVMFSRRLPTTGDPDGGVGVQNTGVVPLEIVLFDSEPGALFTAVCYDDNDNGVCDSGDSVPIDLTGIGTGTVKFTLAAGDAALYEGFYVVTGPISSLNFSDTITASAWLGDVEVDMVEDTAHCSELGTPGISVTKTCTPFFENGDTFRAEITGGATNEGNVKLINVALTDTVFGPGDLTIVTDTNEDGIVDPGEPIFDGDLIPGEKLAYKATFLSTTATSHFNTATAYGENVFNPGTGPGKSDEASASTTADICKIDPDPKIKITKNCDTSINGTGVQLVAEGGVVLVEVGNVIKVENDGDEVLNPVTVSDSEVALSTTAAGWDCTTTPGVCIGSLGLSESITFTQTYYPDGGNINGALNNPGSLYFKNTATAAGAGVISKIPAGPETADAECKICPDCPECP